MSHESAEVRIALMKKVAEEGPNSVDLARLDGPVKIVGTRIEANGTEVITLVPVDDDSPEATSHLRHSVEPKT